MTDQREDSTEVQIADALKLLELLVAAPCEGADEHSWRKCARRLHEQAQEIERLRAQALAISASLAEFRIGPCSLPQGVLELGQRAEATEARLRDLEGRTDDGPQPPQ